MLSDAGVERNADGGWFVRDNGGRARRDPVRAAQFSSVADQIARAANTMTPKISNHAGIRSISSPLRT